MAYKPAYGLSGSFKDDNQHELGDLPATDKTKRYKGVAETVEGELKNTKSHKASLVTGIALTTALLALVVAMMSVGLSAGLNSNLYQPQSTALNYNSEIQSLVDEVKRLQLSFDQSVNNFEELYSQISALQTNTSTQCDILNQAVNNIQNTIREQSDLLNELNTKGSITNLATSCSEISTDRPSGEYWILKNSSPVLVYCDMNRTCCNTTGGWMRVAHLDMTDSNQQCPDGFLLHNENTAPLRTCGRPGPPGCVSTTFPVHGVEYSRVCGRLIGYQFGHGLAFYQYNTNISLTVNDHYVDGGSLTHGQLPRKHIWTFAGALNEINPQSMFSCPCIRPDITYTGVVPPFIGQDYFCDTGIRNAWQSILYRDDPLWNGQGCGGTSTCCSFNNPPWFCKQLQQPTMDDIDLRFCFTNNIDEEDMYLELVDIFVQ